MATERQKKIRQDTSLRLRKAAKLAFENGGNKSKAMRDAGFSEAYSKNPQKLTRSKAYSEILRKAGVTDEMISKNGKKSIYPPWRNKLF